MKLSFVTVVPKLLNYATFSKYLSADLYNNFVLYR